MMRKIILSINITDDGFIAGAEGELNWHFRYWCEEMSVSLCKLLSTADTILLGRKTYAAFAGYWSVKGIELSIAREDIALARMLNGYKKIVVSRRMSRPAWANSSILRVKDGLPGQILQLKQKGDKNIVILGSPSLASSLIELNLIDEYHLWIHPISIAAGKTLVLQANCRELISVEYFSTGVVKRVFGSIGGE